MKYSITLLPLFLILFMAFPKQMASQAYEFPEFQSFTLDNGLTVYLMEQHEVPLISVSAVFPAGAIKDGTRSGLANLTAEALMHGTTSYTKSEIDETLDFLGAEVNTYAGKEFAGLRANFAASDLDKVMPVIAEVMQRPVFVPEEFDKARERHLAALERKKEQPRAVIDDFFNQMVFPDHEYGNNIDGNLTSVKGLTTDDLRKFYTTNYRPEGSAISIVGDFDIPALKTVIETHFSQWQAGGGSLENLSPPTPLAKGNKVLLVNKDDATETTFYIGSRGIPRNNPDFLKIMVINTLFGGRFTSMLNDELRVNSGLTYGARSRFESMKAGGSFSIRTFTATETTEQAIDKALEVLDKLHQGAVSDKDLESAKNYVKGQFPPTFETSGQQAALLTDMFWYGFNEEFINTFNSNVDLLDMEEANRIINAYFPKENLQIVMIGKASEISEIAAKYGEVTRMEITDLIK